MKTTGSREERLLSFSLYDQKIGNVISEAHHFFDLPEYFP